MAGLCFYRTKVRKWQTEKFSCHMKTLGLLQTSWWTGVSFNAVSTTRFFRTIRIRDSTSNETQASLIFLQQRKLKSNRSSCCLLDSGENLQINLRVFSVSFQLGLSAHLCPFMSLSRCPLWVFLCARTTFIFCLHSTLNGHRRQTSHDVYNKQEKSLRLQCVTPQIWS